MLVGRFTPVMRGVVRGYGLNAADVEDAVQATWTAAFVNIDRLREPEAISGWLLVAARRQALRILERSRRELLTDDQDRVDRSTDATPESTLLDHEQRETLSAAVSRLPDRQRAVLDSLEPGHQLCRYLPQAEHPDRVDRPHPRTCAPALAP